MGDDSDPDRQERTVVLSPRLYAPEAIRLSAERFTSHATIRIVEDEGGIRVSFSQPDGEIEDDLVDSFCNHALFETVRSRRAQEREAQP
jgi:hypothetical protein